MKPAQPPPNEEARIAELRETELLDTEPERLFDDLAKIASVICGTPIALVSLVDTDRQWFKARVGLEAAQTPRDLAFCAHAILQGDVFVVEDAHRDDRFADNPLVTDAPHVRFYAGAPLVTQEGNALGTLCVIDHVPHKLLPAQQEALAALGRQVVANIELRRSATSLTREVGARQDAQTQSEQFFAISLDLLCIAGVDGRFKKLNPAWEHVLGYSLDDLVGKEFASFIHPDDIPSTNREIARLAEGALTIGFRNRFRHRDGSHRIFEWRAAPDVATGLLYAAASDVTEAQNAAERTQTMLEASASGMVLVDASGAIALVNRETERLFGYTRDELIGQSVDLLVPDQVRDAHPALRESFTRAPRARSMGAGRSLTARRRDGTEIAVEVGLTPIETPEGAMTLATVIDVSARQEVNRMKDEFISIVSHELRTPLTSIRGSLRLLEGEVSGALAPPVMQLVKIASDNTERLIRLINDILDVEKIEAGKLELNTKDLDAAAVATAAVSAVQGMADQAGVGIELEVGPISFQADDDRVMQVLVNLLSNAVKFSSPGESVLIASSQVPGGRVRFSVTDRGPGISEADLPRLFGKFQQLDASDTRSKGGTGLGLAISKAIVTHHGGEIGVDSQLGKGSTFWFELPVAGATQAVAETAASAEAPTPPLAGPASTRLTAPPLALLVEDDPDAARVVQLFLESEGLGVTLAHSIEEAKRVLESTSPTVIVLDLGLPDGHGFTLLEWARSRETTRDIPVVVLSGSGKETVTGPMPFLIDWLQKPFDDHALAAAIRRAGVRKSVARALVVEDDESARLLLVESLRRVGVEAREASTGQEAVRIAQSFDPDLIILDVGLPVLDGFSVVDILREGPHRDTPLVVYSGRDLGAKERAALTLGVTRFVTKAGASDDDFLDAVRELLRGVLKD